MRCSTLVTALLVAALAALPDQAAAARWIAPAFAPGQEPSYKPVPLYWFEVKETPFAYRTVVTAKPGLRYAVAEARSPSYLYVFVDGRKAYEHTPRDDAPGSRLTPHLIDLTPYLTPGRHALVVSAPREGFALDGALQYAEERAPLSSGASWKVLKLPPTTILEDHSWLRVDTREQGAPVAEGDAFSADTPFSRIAALGRARRAIRDHDDSRWRLGLLARRGIAVVEGSAYGWAGAERASGDVVKRAGALLARLREYEARIDALRARPESAGDPEASLLAERMREVAAETARLCRQQLLLDEVTALALAALVVPGGRSARVDTGRLRSAILSARSPSRLSALAGELRLHRETLAAGWGGTLNLLNESRSDRLGWLPHPDLVDSQIGSWGLRVGPITAPASLTLDGREWLFSTDPQDTGESEKRQAIGYNIENQWPKVAVPGSWTDRDATKDYAGTAWYRTRVIVPAEWRGHDVVLRYEARDADKVWVNDTLVGSTPSPGFRRYQIGSEVIRAGAENVLAFKVTGRGGARGITGSVTLSCPGLEGQRPSAPTARVLATPLSPAAVLTPEGRVLEIRGWAERKQPGPSAILLPARSSGKGAAPSHRRVPAGRGYRLDRDGRLPANWALLWLEGRDRDSLDRPVLLVFERHPVSIQATSDSVRVTFRQPGARVVAVRPWVKSLPAVGSRAFAEAVCFWSRAALALPVNYLSLTRELKPGPPPDFAFTVANVPPGAVTHHTVIYNYLTTKDDWGTRPLRVAPLPSLASYALDCGFRGLRLDQKPEIAQDGGLLSPYRVVRGSGRVSYSYPIEPWPRLIGFTSWMFSYADSGVPGNQRELELLKTTGANSYRPQHNFGTEVSPFYGPDNKRTRVEVLADYCREIRGRDYTLPGETLRPGPALRTAADASGPAAFPGMTYINNIDQTLGDDRKVVQTQYAAFMERVNKHYEGIARQLHDRPFLEVAYDLINEPFDHKHEAYNQAMKTLTARIRAIDPVHLLYIEPCEAWGAIEQLQLIEPTGDPLTVYSFHDYNFRLFRPTDRWPTEERDISSICRQWTEAFRFAVRHGVGMHCGEFGGFDNSTDDEEAQLTLLSDFFRVFDQFGMHHHYYSGRQVFPRRADGSMALSNVVRAYRRYLGRPSP